MAILSIEHVSKRFGSFTALDDVSLQVEQGEAVAIIGSSGSGKSTLLRCVNNLERVSAGRIVIDGDVLVDTVKGTAKYPPEKEVRRICTKTGMVFQHFNLFPHLTCLENITVAPLRILKRDKAAVLAEAMELLDVVGLRNKADNYPAQLSGGQKQRIAIARALAMNPQIMLFDEPTSALDPETTNEVIVTIQKLVARAVTMLIVTHDMRFARDSASSVLFMDEGKIHDKLGREGDFSNAIIIFTSNIASSWIAEKFNQGITPDSKHLTEVMSQHFRPEFLGRLTEVVPFAPINETVAQSIFRLHFSRLQQQLQEQKNIHIQITDEALRFLSAKGYSPQYGARPIAGVVRTYLKKSISRLIVSEGIKEGDSVKVYYRDNGLEWKRLDI